MSENNGRINSRLNNKHRKKKSNTIINILIGVVLLLIITTVAYIVTDNDPDVAREEVKSTSKDDSEKNSVPEEENDDSSQIETIEPSTVEQNDTSSESSTSENSEVEQDESETNEDTTIETSTSEDPNVDNVIVDPTWKPIGTTQTGEHTSSYDSKSVDWAEKVEALAYAAGFDQSNMYVKFLGNGGSPQKSIGTVTSKDGTEIYRIHLEWIDGHGWKPTKKEKLKTLEDAP